MEATERQREIAKQWGLEFTDLSTCTLDGALIREVADRLPDGFFPKHKAIPLARRAGDLHVAGANPLDIDAIEEIHFLTQMRVVYSIADEKLVAQALERFLSAKPPREAAQPKPSPQTPRPERPQRPQPAHLVETVLREALRTGAPEVLLQPEATRLRVRHRVNGLLVDAGELPSESAPQLTAHLKALAGIASADPQMPHDGRGSVANGSDHYELHVSTIPGIHGERVLLRLKRLTPHPPELRGIGLPDKTLRQLEGLLATRSGLFIIAGPRASGRTTTLYAVVQHLNTPERDVATIEDIVRMRLPGVTQVQVAPNGHAAAAQSSPAAAACLRALLAQGPDVIMVRQLRDRETAELAAQAALTGHLLLSSAHARDAAGAVPALLRLGLAPLLLSSSLVGVLAQRLVRALCPSCREPCQIPVEAITRLKLPSLPGFLDAVAYRAHPGGCAACNGHGYVGHVPLFELLVVSDEIRRLILESPTPELIAQTACKEGMVPLRADAGLKVINGVTSADEALNAVRC